jgi:hypothetical protein
VSRAHLAATPKWGGRVLRAPAALDEIARALRDGDELGAAHRVAAYLITGCDRFFYLDPGTAAGLDPACVLPAVKSTRGESRIALDAPPARYLFSCREPERYAPVTATGAYLAAGHATGIPGLSGVRGRRPWCAIEQQRAPVLAVRTARDRHLAYLNPHGHASGEFHRVWPAPALAPVALAAFLNSSVAGLQLEALGRAYGGGGGPLKLERRDLARLRLPPVARLQAAAADLERALAPLLERPLGTVPAELDRADRAPLEALCGELAGLQPAAVDAVREAHATAVTARVERARRVLVETA